MTTISTENNTKINKQHKNLQQNDRKVAILEEKNASIEEELTTKQEKQFGKIDQKPEKKKISYLYKYDLM